ncbi:MAG: type III-B CRISPR module-associated protein Cmr5 [Thermoguttaceae bacterium]
MSMQTRSQKLAQAAFSRIQDRKQALTEKQFDEYKSFAKKFPALIHTCGLAQAITFALAKKETEYVEDLAAVLKASGHPEITSAQALDDQARTQPLSGYLRFSRDAINAAGWLKRYAEAAGEGD